MQIKYRISIARVNYVKRKMLPNQNINLKTTVMAFNRLRFSYVYQAWLPFRLEMFKMSNLYNRFLKTMIKIFSAE